MSVLHVFVKISHFSSPNNVTMHLKETETKTFLSEYSRLVKKIEYKTAID